MNDAHCSTRTSLKCDDDEATKSVRNGGAGEVLRGFEVIMLLGAGGQTGVVLSSFDGQHARETSSHGNELSLILAYNVSASVDAWFIFEFKH